MKKLKHIGPGYSGTEPILGGMVNAKTGEIVEVTEEKAVQLFSDFPKEWVEIVEKVATEEPKRGRK